MAIMHILLRTFFHTLLTFFVFVVLFNKYGRWIYTKKKNLFIIILYLFINVLKQSNYPKYNYSEKMCMKQK